MTRLDKQTEDEILRDIQNPIQHRHLVPRGASLRLLFLTKQNARADAGPDVDFVLAQEEFPAAVVDLGVPAQAAEDLPEEVEDKDEQRREILLEERGGAEIWATRRLHNVRTFY